MSVAIADARGPDDIAVVIGLLRAYAAALSVDLCFQGFEAELDDLANRYGPPHGALLLARRIDGEALGCVALRSTSTPAVCEMKRLYLAPAARGQGVGKALVAAILDRAAALGYRAMRLDTLPEMREAMALYRSLGFEPIAPYYDTPVAGTLFLERTLTAPA